MSKYVLSAMESLSCPYHCLSISKIKVGKVYIMGAPELSVANYAEVVSGIYVAPDFCDSFTKEYFETALAGKKTYVPLHLHGGYIPTTTGAKILVLEPNEDLPPESVTGWEYKPLHCTDEAIVADIYRNACAYKYDHHVDAFVRLAEKEALQNSLKLYMQKMIMTISGDSFDRIADLSRIVLFLLSKVELTPEEREAIEPLLEYAPDSQGLAGVFEREIAIQEYVASVKNDPAGYIYGQK